MQYPKLEHYLTEAEKGFEYRIRWSDRPDLVAVLHFDSLSEVTEKPGGFKRSIDALRNVYSEAGVPFRDPFPRKMNC